MPASASPKLRTGLIVAGVAAVAAVLFFFSPAEFGFYPRCLLYATTGWQCPGCGGLRAAHQLLHGHLAAAFRLNPLLIALLPVVAGFFAASWIQRRTGRDWMKPLRHPLGLWLLVMVVIAFTIARNRPALPL